jgi:hypothetical protein
MIDAGADLSGVCRIARLMAAVLRLLLIGSVLLLYLKCVPATSSPAAAEHRK